jgi:hypothetical protein
VLVSIQGSAVPDFDFTKALSALVTPSTFRSSRNLELVTAARLRLGLRDVRRVDGAIGRCVAHEHSHRCLNYITNVAGGIAHLRKRGARLLLCRRDVVSVNPATSVHIESEVRAIRGLTRVTLHSRDIISVDTTAPIDIAK